MSVVPSQAPARASSSLDRIPNPLSLAISDPASESSDRVHQLADELVERLAALVPCVVAFSGGVDSAVVAAAVMRAQHRKRERNEPLQRSSIAVTAISPAVPMIQREIAVRVARELDMPHETVMTDEGTRPDYIRNDLQRCFHCKQTLYAALQRIAEFAAAASADTTPSAAMPIVSGTNADDLGDHRPGIEAGRMAGVRTPLADLGISKRIVRGIAAHWGLSVADLPAAPCLASRIAYGVEVTADRLARIERAEAWLAGHGFSPLRVRLHAGELARIEVAADAIARLVSKPLADQLRTTFAELGFRAVTVDLGGFQSGSLNRLVSLHPPKAKASNG